MMICPNQKCGRLYTTFIPQFIIDNDLPNVMKCVCDTLIEWRMDEMHDNKLAVDNHLTAPYKQS